MHCSRQDSASSSQAHAYAASALRGSASIAFGQQVPQSIAAVAGDSLCSNCDTVKERIESTHHQRTKQMKEIQKFRSFLHFFARWLAIMPGVSSPPATPLRSLETPIVARMVAVGRKTQWSANRYRPRLCRAFQGLKP